MSAGLSLSQRTYLAMVKLVLAEHPKWAYLDPAWIMAIMQIESGYRPLVINAAGRQDGLMQVIPSTAQDMAVLYGIPAGPQTDPMISIQSGTATLDCYARHLIRALNASSVPLWTLAKAYNGGWVNLVPGANPSASWLASVEHYVTKFRAALQIVEAQLEGTAMIIRDASFMPMRKRGVSPLDVIGGCNEA